MQRSICTRKTIFKRYSRGVSGGLLIEQNTPRPFPPGITRIGVVGVFKRFSAGKRFPEIRNPYVGISITHT